MIDSIIDFVINHPFWTIAILLVVLFFIWLYHEVDQAAEIFRDDF